MVPKTLETTTNYATIEVVVSDLKAVDSPFVW